MTPKQKHLKLNQLIDKYYAVSHAYEIQASQDFSWQHDVCLRAKALRVSETAIVKAYGNSNFAKLSDIHKGGE